MSRIADAKGLLDRQRSEARQILRKLLDQPLRFEAYEDEMGRKGYRVTGQGSTFNYYQYRLHPLVWCPQRETQTELLETSTGSHFPRNRSS